VLNLDGVAQAATVFEELWCEKEKKNFLGGETTPYIN